MVSVLIDQPEILTLSTTENRSMVKPLGIRECIDIPVDPNLVGDGVIIIDEKIYVYAFEQDIEHPITSPDSLMIMVIMSLSFVKMWDLSLR